MFFKSLLVVAAMTMCSYAGASTYAYVDLQKAMETVKEGATAKAKLEKEFNDKKKTISNREEEIKRMTAEYQKKQLLMNNDKKAEEEQRIQKKMMEYRELVQQSEVQMQKRQMELTQPIIENLRTVISDIASKEKYDLVYEKNQSGIFFASNAKDITADAIKGYDEKIKPTDGKKGKK
jgi:outer membrane protein